ncbi:peptidyl-tRNA hydrolase ICT1, mitochondrial [Thalassophryne amazonica]|uniref:peptidyl-tRNA hydrolase ICT1, mitochondrial n=1 Tax=Thalassophryne amazonica TaxID=390379 RepID=UPI0014711FCE|nr:peptidyl-tRNA hydrolase ICT1, mitochondrial [Thalassophryne amazonica]
MAAEQLGRFCCRYFFSFSVINQNSRHVKLRGFVIRAVNDTPKQTAGFTTRRRDDNQDTEVHVPIDHLTISYSRSRGPGGQHVNKVNSRAEVRFLVQTADWIPADVRQKILEKNKNQINKAGELLVTSELSRNQQRNLNDCVKKIAAIIAEAGARPYEPTAEDIALRESRLERRNKERLKQKMIHSATKQSRRMDFD